jgi:outer membrane protein assembly factor BamB
MMVARVHPTHNSLRNALRVALPMTLALALTGCSTMSSITSWFSSSEKKILPLPAVTGNASVVTSWQSVLGGKQLSSLMPAVANGRVYAAHPTGALIVADEATGAVVNRFQVPLSKGAVSGGVAASADLIVVGTNKAEVVALDMNGAMLWSTKVSSEVIAPAAISEAAVIVQGGDGVVTALDPKTGARKWSLQRQLPALTVRSSSLPVAARGAVFVGTPTGKLLAVDASNGAIGWEATVATPKGTSELERLIDVVGRPVMDNERICAAAYQGRVACFDLVRGTLLWSRDLSSLTGPLLDAKYVYVSDDKGVVQAFDKTTGGTVWKQDVLAGRRATGTALVGDYVAVQDAQGSVHLVDRNSGKIAGRGLGEAFIADVGMVASGNGALVQTRSGQLASISAR